MDLENLKAFVSVAQERSFSLAATKLHLTQPAVSKRIAALEADLQTRLFDRIGRQVQTTEAGRALLPRAEGILLQIKQAKQAMDDLAGDVRGDLRIATSHHIGLHKLPPYLRHFASRYGEVNLKIEFLDSEVALERVARGTCELAVVTLAPEPVDQLICEPLWEDALAFVTHPKAPLAQPASLATLSRLPAILPDLSTYTGRLVKACFDKQDLPLTLNMATNYLETIKMMVSVGLGWSVLPESMVDEHVQKLAVPGVQLSRTLGLVRHHKRHLSNAASAFYVMLRTDNPTVHTDTPPW